MFELFADRPGRYFAAAALAPLAGVLVLLVAGVARRLADPRANPTRGPGYFAVAVMALSTALAVLGVYSYRAGEVHAESLDWLRLGARPPTLTAPPDVWETRLTFGYYADELVAVLVPMVCLVTTLVMVFSLGYMREEANPAVVDHALHHARRGRSGQFFLYLLLFAFSMLFLLLGDNLVQVFVGWELVGVSSYFLIGFYTERPAATAAATKAFVINRVGDAGFLLAILVAWPLFHELNVSEMSRLVASGQAPRGDVLTLLGLGLFAGCVGKSAQWPLHTWLPDAMEGPTPVSALIHAATMVAAGVYLLARCFALFTPDCLAVIACVGAFTMLFAATVALTQADIKKVLAYSTMSQLGLMVLAVGLGAPAAALFHLVTHACFKALLFLGAGSVIHALHHEQDLRAMGGLRRRLPLTAAVMLVGVLAISGVPFLSGWASKEVILGASLEHLRAGGPLAWLGALPFVGAALTAYYMLRLWLLTFAGEPRGEAVAGAHEGGFTMALPLLALAGLTVVVGGGSPVWEADSAVLFGFLCGPHPAAPHAEGSHTLALVLGLGCFLLGFAVALARHFRGTLLPAAAPRPASPLDSDVAYAAAFTRPTLSLGRLVAAADKRPATAPFDLATLDGVMSLPADAAPALARRLQAAQSGNVRHYVLALALTLTAALAMLTLLR